MLLVITTNSNVKTTFTKTIVITAQALVLYVPHFGGFFYSRSVNDLKGYNKSYYSEPMYRYKSKFYNGAGQFFGSYRNQSTKVATSNLNKRGGGTIGRAMSRGGFGKAVSVSRGG